MNYEETYKRFPPASNVPWGKAGGGDCHMEYTGNFGPNWAVALLPFIEQQGLYNANLTNLNAFPGVFVGVPTNTEPAGVNGLAWRSFVDQRIPVYTCPTDGNNLNFFVNPAVPGAPQGWARGNYGVTAGYEDYDHVAGGAIYKTSSKGVAKGLTSSPMMSSNYGCKIADVMDGTSNTIMVAELRAGLSPIDPRGVWAMGLRTELTIVPLRAPR
jgi:hypothetical protein